MKLDRPDIAIVGGGIIGLACARRLALEGAEVVLLDGGAFGRHSSSAAAGMLAPLSEVRTPGPLFEACRLARDQWGAFHEAVEAESGHVVEYDRSGALITAMDPEEEAVLREIEAAASQLVEPAERLAADELFERIPDLNRSATDALLLPGEHRVNNLELLPALVASARRAGADLRDGVEVTALDLAAGAVTVQLTDGRLEAGSVLIAAGAWAGPLAPTPLPVRPVRGQMIQIQGAAWPWTGNVRVGGHYYGIRRAEDGLLFGATLEEAGFDDRTTAGGLEELLAALRRAFPGLADRRPTGFWSGLRPGTTDGLPVVGRLGDSRVWVAGGHFRNGILLAPWTAEAVTPWILGAEPEPEGQPFSPNRFRAGSSGG